MTEKEENHKQLRETTAQGRGKSRKNIGKERFEIPAEAERKTTGDSVLCTTKRASTALYSVVAGCALSGDQDMPWAGSSSPAGCAHCEYWEGTCLSKSFADRTEPLLLAAFSPFHPHCLENLPRLCGKSD